MQLSSAPPTPVRASTLPPARVQFRGGPFTSPKPGANKSQREAKSKQAREAELSLCRELLVAYSSPPNEKHLQRCQNSLGGFHGGACGYLTLPVKYHHLQGRPNQSGAAREESEAAVGTDHSSGSPSTKAWGCCLGFHLSPEKAQRLQVMAQRSPGELQDTDLPTTKKKKLFN